jgi:LysR family transcriptional regulator for metE and metH
MPSPTLEVRHLSLVHEIAATGSVTRAAERLHLTQSALSHQLRDIESRLGLQLFLRLGKRMVLTPPGERVLGAARRVLDEIGRTEDDLKMMSQHGKGVLRLCTQCNTGYHWLAPLLAVYQRRHPRVSVNIAADATDRPLEALLDGRVDLAILIDAQPDRRLRLQPLFTDEMIAIVAKSDALARKRWLSAEDLAGRHLLLYTSVPEESFVLRQVLGPAGLTPARVSFIMLTEAMIELARAGTGVGVLPRWSAQRAIASGAVVPLAITRRGMRRLWSAATLAPQPPPPYLTDFIDLLGERALPARGGVRESA